MIAELDEARGPVAHMAGLMAGVIDAPAHAAASLKLTLANSDRIRESLLEHVHGTARPGRTPDLLALAKLHRGYVDFVESLSESYIALCEQLQSRDENQLL